MPRSCSVAEARQRLTQILRNVERGNALEITRRGRPVAVLVSAAEYARLSGPRSSFAAAVDEFRASVAPKDLRGSDPFARVRDRRAGRAVDL